MHHYNLAIIYLGTVRLRQQTFALSALYEEYLKPEETFSGPNTASLFFHPFINTLTNIVQNLAVCKHR